MANTIDLTGDGGVLKTVIRKAKADAITPSDSFPLVDGMRFSTKRYSQLLVGRCFNSFDP
jgi:hypothetical protein